MGLHHFGGKQQVGDDFAGKQQVWEDHFGAFFGWSTWEVTGSCVRRAELLETRQQLAEAEQRLAQAEADGMAGGKRAEEGGGVLKVTGGSKKITGKREGGDENLARTLAMAIGRSFRPFASLSGVLGRGWRIYRAGGWVSLWGEAIFKDVTLMNPERERAVVPK